MSCYSNESCLAPSTGDAPQIFSSALRLFAAAQCCITQHPYPDRNICDDAEFDIIIVGAGTAGCVLANRLSEIPDWKVLLIEAGNDPPVESHIPALRNSLFSSKYDWQYLTTYNGITNQANINGSIRYPRGKMIGGSSNINSMIYIKGRKDDYKSWFNAGNKDWHPDVLEAYFKKAESFQNQMLLNTNNVSSNYGHNGPLTINRYNATNRNLTERIIDSYDEIGIPRVVDLNTEEGPTNRSGIMSVTAANGVRQSHDYAYLKPIQNRPNLTILKNTLVTKVLINANLTAYGIKVERKGKIRKIYARLEVILSAGSINTPKLLLLSGVGPKKQLKSNDIECKVDRQMVGQNLQDHCIVPVTIYGNGPNKPDQLTRYFGALQYIYNRTGYLAESSVTDILAFYSTLRNATYPEYQNHMAIVGKNDTQGIYNSYSEVFRYKDVVINSIAELNKNHTLFAFRFNLLHPKSRGNVSLRSNNPKDHPFIFPNFFSNEEDLNSAVVGIKILLNIVNTKYFKSIKAFVGRIKWPACDDLVFESDDYWKCICINMVVTVYHPVGTCKMGPDPETSVVDSRLKVHGVEKLRVIDASVMPSITSGNTNAPTGMVGERGADLVKQDHNKL